MSILSGFKKFKRYVRTEDDNYILDSEWTSSETVQMNNGSTLEETLGGITGITDSTASDSSNIAASAKAVSTLKQNMDEHTHDDRYYTETEIDGLLGDCAKTSQLGTKITATLSGTTLYLNF